jgi:hypothetical protein
MRKKRPTASNSDAVFIGWQKTHTGSAFALYSVTAAGHPYYGSTVSEETLSDLNLQIPKQQSSKDKESRFDSEKRDNM